MQCIILLNAEICMREQAEAIEVWSPSFPRSLKKCLARAQRAVHWTNTTPLPQADCRDSQQTPSETVDASTHVDYSRTRFLWEQQGRKCKVLPATATITEYQGKRNVRHSTVLPACLEMAMRWYRTAFSRKVGVESSTGKRSAHQSEFHAGGMGCFWHRTLAL